MKKTRSKARKYLKEQCSQPKEQKIKGPITEHVSCREGACRGGFRDVSGVTHVKPREVERTSDFILCAGKSPDDSE